MQTAIAIYYSSNKGALEQRVRREGNKLSLPAAGAPDSVM